MGAFWDFSVGEPREALFDIAFARAD